MCGIAGFAGWKGSFSEAEDSINGMKKSLHHRGPDSSGVWKSSTSNIFLAHSRLSIIDLSNKAHQPMTSKNGRFILCYNGEIYNHLEIRQSLKSSNANIKWESSSDTETLVEAFSVFGVIKTLKLIRGMFAIALFDVWEKKLHLIRDRFGEKPLYFIEPKNGFLAFCSEIKALKKIIGFKPEIDINSMASFFNRGYIGSSQSVWQGVKKILPGTIMTFRKVSSGYAIERQITFWSTREEALLGQRNLYQGSYENAKNDLDNILTRVIADQLISDVPLGVFLSGGVDSSLIASFSQKASLKKIKTFSIGFEEKSFDESGHAKEIANHLGTSHENIFATPNDALEIIQDLPLIYCEPFADSSQIPTVLLSRLVKKKVTVALSGDGGDELFGGYTRYTFGNRSFRIIKNCPLIFRAFLARMIRRVPPKFFQSFGDTLGWSDLERKIYKLGDVLACRSFEEYYELLTTYWPAGTVMKEVYEKRQKFEESLGCVENMMLADQLNYLPDDILVKVDRAAMASSLETRAPLLDHQLAEFAWKLPSSWRIEGRNGKKLLKDVLYQYIPRNLINRPKQGFGVPISRWLRGPLRDWAQDLCSQSNLPEDGLIRGSLVRRKLDEHLSGKRNWDYRLWPILMWQQWQEVNRLSDAS